MAIHIKADALKLVSAIVGALLPSIKKVQDDAIALQQARTGQEKALAAIALAKDALLAAEDVSGKDIVNDPEWEAVIASLNDILVRATKLAAKKQQATLIGAVPASAASLGVPAGSTGD